MIAKTPTIKKAHLKTCPPVSSRAQELLAQRVLEFRGQGIHVSNIPLFPWIPGFGNLRRFAPKVPDERDDNGRNVFCKQGKKWFLEVSS